MFEPGNGKVLRCQSILLTGSHVQDCHVRRANPSEDTCAVLDRDRSAISQADTTAEVGFDRASWCIGINPGPFEKEVAFLRKTQREASQVDLPVIHLRFRKIGIDRHRRLEIWGDAVVDVETRIAGRPAVLISNLLITDNGIRLGFKSNSL